MMNSRHENQHRDDKVHVFKILGHPISSTSSYSTQEGIPSQRHHHTQKQGSASASRNVWIGRILFCCSLLGMAILLGYLAHYILTESEKELAERQFLSIADRALDSSSAITLRKRRGTVTMAQIMGLEFPNQDEWPNVYLNGYGVIATQLIQVSSGRNMGFAPIVNPEELDDFEEFAYKKYKEQYGSDSLAGTSNLGNGIWERNPTTDEEFWGPRNGTTSWVGSQNQILAPFLHHNKGPDGPLMQNIYSHPERGPVIDDIMECSRLREGNRTIECGEITDVFMRKGEPAALILQPVYPTNDLDMLTGVIVSSILWSESLAGVFADEVSGVDCVLETDSDVWTYTVRNGHAVFKGEGDLHSEKYAQYAKATSLTGEPGEYFSRYSSQYNLTLYPTEELFQVYSTRNPYIATIGAVCIILFTSISFSLYDFFVRQEFNEKRAVLRAKRLFVRYISHEVRTPLNAACMGLKLIQEEIGRAMQCPRSSTSKEESSSYQDFAQELMNLSVEVLSNTEWAVNVLNDVLFFDKIEMGKLKLELSILPVWHIIEKTFNEFKLAATSRKLHVELEFRDELTGKVSLCADHAEDLTQSARAYKMIGDTVRFAQVLRNLISNALKFTPDGGNLTVSASLTRKSENSAIRDDLQRSALAISSNSSTGKTFKLNDGERITVTTNDEGLLNLHVTDTGAGMTKEQLDELFREGVQFNVNRLQAGQGSGLGLFIAKGIVEQHGGCLTAHSEGLGKGATFTVAIPLYQIEDKIEENIARHASDGVATCTVPFGNNETSDSVSNINSSIKTEATIGETDAEKLRILIVDDSLTNRKLLMRLLHNRGHDCDCAKDGSEAVQMVMQALEEKVDNEDEEASTVNRAMYDSILLDYEMPIVDGPTAAREIRRLGCDSFIVGITGNVLPEDVTYFQNCGADCVLPKLVHVESLEQLWVEFGIGGRDIPATVDRGVP